MAANYVTSADAGIPVLLRAGRARPRAAEFHCYCRRPEGVLPYLQMGGQLGQGARQSAHSSRTENGAECRRRLLSMCGRKYGDVGEDGHSCGAKRLECVQLAGAIVKRGRSESGSKLRALQTLRAQERPHRATIRHWTYDPEH